METSLLYFCDFLDTIQPSSHQSLLGRYNCTCQVLQHWTLLGTKQHQIWSCSERDGSLNSTILMEQWELQICEIGIPFKMHSIAYSMTSVIQTLETKVAHTVYIALKVCNIITLKRYYSTTLTNIAFFQVVQNPDKGSLNN